MNFAYLGANLRRRRRAMDLTQKTIATRAGLGRAYICYLERGLRPTRDTDVALLARALRVSRDSLLRRPPQTPGSQEQAK